MAIPYEVVREQEFDKVIEGIICASTMLEVDKVMDEAAGNEKLADRDFTRLTFLAKAYIEAHRLCP